MDTQSEYPERVTLQPNGSFRWNCPIEKEYERRAYRHTLYFCGGLAAFLLVFGTVLSVMYEQSVLIPVLSTGGIMLIVLLLCFILDRLPGTMTEDYILTDKYIHTGHGKSGAYFDFRRTKEAVFNNRYIELRGPFGGPRVYVPEEDMPLVRDFILSRLPGDAEIRYGT